MVASSVSLFTLCIGALLTAPIKQNLTAKSAALNVFCKTLDFVW